MKTAEQILKSQGLTDPDIAAMSTLLADPRYRAAIEGSVNAIEAERDQLMTRNNEWQDLLDTKYNPTIAGLEKTAADARREAADLKEQIKIAKEYGYFGDEAEAKARQAIEDNKRQEQAAKGGGFDPEDPKFRDYSGRFAVGQGKAMAMYTDIAGQHQRLFGEPLDGFEALYDEFVSMRPQDRQGTSIRNLWEKKYNVQQKRQEIEAKKQADHDAEVSRKAVEKYALEHGTNPNTQAPNISRNPIMPTAARDGKQPWEIPTLTSDRRQRAWQNEVKQNVN